MGLSRNKINKTKTKQNHKTKQKHNNNVLSFFASRADLKEMVCGIWESYNRYVMNNKQDFPRNLEELDETYQEECAEIRGNQILLG